ncbi:MAG: phosphoenolpyruvate--protein phosphotransferase [Candidatus Omnitrophota bacterium]
MKTLKGMAASPGLVKGTACVYSETGIDQVPHYNIPKKRVGAETLRLDEALEKAKGSMAKMIEASKELFDKRAAEIFNAHLMILSDPVLYDKIVSLIRSRSINAEHAVDDAFEEYIKSYKMSDLHFAELSHDTVDVKNRILSSFAGLSGRFECPDGEKQAVIVVSKRLTPSLVLHIQRENVLAFITEEGGFTTHATILARSYDVPVIFGIDVEEHISCGDKVIIDGFHGKVFIAPDSKTDKLYSKKIEDLSKKKAVCEVRKIEPSQTKMGARVSLKANISLPGEMELLKGLHYDGVGLLRTEFLFVNKGLPPTEEEQFRMYRHIAEEAEGREVTLRLLDIGPDKMPGYLHLPAQDNPDLGIRGARALGFFYNIYLAQIKAAMRAARHGKIRILFPMVSDLNDVNAFKALALKAKSALKKEKKPFKEVDHGIMIETPSAALMADLMLKNVDFANIGSNDLLQYTLAASRGNTAVEMRYHIMHPALIKLIELIIASGKRNKKELCLCGEIASFAEFYPFFLSLGLASFSVAASKLDHIKCELLHLKRLSRPLTDKIYKAVTVEEIDRIFGR